MLYLLFSDDIKVKEKMRTKRNKTKQKVHHNEKQESEFFEDAPPFDENASFYQMNLSRPLLKVWLGIKIMFCNLCKVSVYFALYLFVLLYLRVCVLSIHADSTRQQVIQTSCYYCYKVLFLIYELELNMIINSLSLYYSKYFTYSQAIAAMNFIHPTPIQAATIPVALMGRDVSGCAATGTGKTAAYMLPILERLLYRPLGDTAVTRVLVLVPTRELGVQVYQVTRQLAQFTNIEAGLAVGGLDLKAQVIGMFFKCLTEILAILYSL
jgi:hypothetical protein